MTELFEKIYTSIITLLVTFSFTFDSLLKNYSQIYRKKTNTSVIETSLPELEKTLPKKETYPEEPLLTSSSSLELPITREKTPPQGASKTEKEQAVIDTYTSPGVTSFQKYSKRPCTQVIEYKLGTFDPRFEISKNDFLRIANESSSLWSNALGSTLFVYNDHGPLTINLIYDDRQERTKENELLKAEIANTRNAADNLEKAYMVDKSEYQRRSTIYASRAEAYTTTFNAYDNHVIALNAKGGATQEEYRQMMTEKESLAIEATSLDNERKQLLLLVENINLKIKKYNEFVAYMNSIIKQVNTFGTKKFTEGKYDPNTNRIDIYQFTDRIKLKRVLAHEFGHVLNIDHLNDKASIMHYLNVGTTTELSEIDILELQKACTSY